MAWTNRWLVISGNSSAKVMPDPGEAETNGRRAFSVASSRDKVSRGRSCGIEKGAVSQRVISSTSSELDSSAVGSAERSLSRRFFPSSTRSVCCVVSNRMSRPTSYYISGEPFRYNSHWWPFLRHREQAGRSTSVNLGDKDGYPRDISAWQVCEISESDSWVTCTVCIHWMIVIPSRRLSLIWLTSCQGT